MNPDSKTDLASLWFYSVNQAVTGPVSFQELASLVQSGTLPLDVLAVPEGSEDWKAFSQWQPASPPPLPPVASSPSTEKEAKAPSSRSDAFPGTKDGNAAGQQEGCKKGCFGCLGLIVVCMLLGMILETCSKPDLTLSDSERQNPKEAVQKLMKAIYGSDLRESEAHQIYEGSVAGGKLNVYVRVNAEPLLSNSSTIFDMDEKMKKAFKALYESGLPVWEVVIWNYAPLIDRYGKKSEEIVYKVGLHSREAAQVEWSNPDSVSFERVWEVKFLHPALTR